MCRFVSVICISLFYSLLGYASDLDDTYRRGLNFKQQALNLTAPQTFKEEEDDPKIFKAVFLSISRLPSEKKKEFAGLLQQSFNCFQSFAVHHGDNPNGWYQCGYISCLGGDMEHTNLYLARLRTVQEKPSCKVLITRLETLRNVRLQPNDDPLLNKLSWTAAIVVSTWGTDFIMQTLKQTVPNLLDPSFAPDMSYFYMPDLQIFEPLVVMLMTKFLVKSSLQFSVATYRGCKKPCKKKNPERFHGT